MPFREFLRLFAHFQWMPALENGDEETLVGGQAVMEGVMMRAPHSYCVAVRKASGEIVTDEKPLPKVSEKHPIFRFPVIRGLGTLGQALGLGIKALQFSANAALQDADPQAAKKEMSAWVLALNLGLSLAFFIFLYKFVPLYLATALGKALPALTGRIPFNLADGIIRMAIFLGFLYTISLWKEMRRVFEYHGAEHRVVFNFESGRPVTVETAQTFSTFHPRCGTSFLLVVMLVSIGVYTLLPFDRFLLKLAGRILLLPLIAGLSYELIRYAAKHRGGLLAALTAPGLWLQRITTKPPSADQTAVAIEALQHAMAIEEAQGGKPVIA
ncbi:MAG: DUF1385 domain-containing protein [Bryobacteraceae bacterium]